MTTSLEQNKINYGFYIRPKTYCKVIQQQLQSEMLLSPNFDYYLPWNKEEIIIVEIKAPDVTGQYAGTDVSINNDIESLGLLKIAESAFEFWNNKFDNIWDEL